MDNKDYLDIQSKLATLTDKDIAEIIDILIDEYMKKKPKEMDMNLLGSLLGGGVCITHAYMEKLPLTKIVVDSIIAVGYEELKQVEDEK